jgi:cardiolipin synthase
LIKDGLQILLGVALLNVEPKIIVPANVFGKATTVLLFATILLSLFRMPGLIYLQLFVGGLAVITFSQYAYHVWQAWGKNKSAKTDN